ncbi:MAG: hypothetical protein ACLQHF_06440 [Terracidiphilus sp.]
MKDLFKLAICWIAFIAAIIASGIIGRIFHLASITLPGGTTVQSMFLLQLVGGVVLVVGLYPLARGLAARGMVRAAAIGGFLLLAFGLNGLIETKVFTHFLDGGIGGAVAFYTTLAVVLGAAIGFSFGSQGQPAGFVRRTLPVWFWRGAVAWLGWPVTYFFFGMCIAPIVTPYYRAGIAGLQLPNSILVLFGVQLIRSVFFLATSLPFVALWKGSRRSLWLTLGLAHAFTIGIFGLVGAAWLPMILRIVHSVEMTGDSFAYAGLLVLLFAAVPEKSNASQTAQISGLDLQATK